MSTITIRKCSDCGVYKYLAKNGKCRDCHPDSSPSNQASTVHIHLDTIHPKYRNNPVALQKITDAVDAHQTIDLTNKADKRQADLEIDRDHVDLYIDGTRERYFYPDYSGSRTAQLRAAVDDALAKAARGG